MSWATLAKKNIRAPPSASGRDPHLHSPKEYPGASGRCRCLTINNNDNNDDNTKKNDNNNNNNNNNNGNNNTNSNNGDNNNNTIDDNNNDDNNNKTTATITTKTTRYSKRDLPNDLVIKIIKTIPTITATISRILLVALLVNI